MMNPSELLLIRHGETSSNLEFRLCGWTNAKLTPRGIEQARVLGEHVARVYRPEVVYASPLDRTRQTAEAIAQHLGAPVSVHDGLKEIHFGDCEDMTQHEFIAGFPELAKIVEDGWERDICWPNGESRDAFHERTRSAIEEICAAHPGRRVAIVSHGGTISSFLSYMIEGRPHAWRRYLAGNCALTRVVFGADGHQFDPLNDTSFLGSLNSQAYV